MTEPSSASRSLGLAYGLACGVIFSFGGLATRFLEAATSWQAVTYRSAFLAAAMALICVLRHGSGVVRVFLAIGRIGVCSAAVLGFANSAYVIGFLNTTVANAQFMMSTGPVLAAALGAAFLRERLSASTWIAIVGVVVGVLVMVYDGLTAGGLTGNIVALFAALSFAVYTVMLRSTRGADMVPVLFLGSCISVALGVLGSDGNLAVTDHDLATLAIMGAVQSVAGFILMGLAARHILAGEVSLLAMAEAILGPIWVWLFIGEIPTPVAFIGGMIVLASVFGFAIAGVRASRKADRFNNRVS